ncbi:MAG: serine/threonine protein kinase [Deltaproteobacteria bacterium]|nr:serine/threonine protein kinase [Deltaproteobacteria bacterium]
MNDALLPEPAAPGAPAVTCPSCNAKVAAPASRCSACGEWLTDPEKLIEPRAGEVLGGRYRLESLIGVGGMARVWRALDLTHDREVALKLLQPELVGDRVAEQRFLNEGKTAREIRHPNAVDVFDHGLFPNGMPYIAMELLEGKLLSELVRQVGALSAERVVRLMLQVAGAVGEAHRRGLVHRDLKPDNIIIVGASDDAHERAVLLDFGIAIHAEGLEAGESKDGLGTPAYAAPEQATGEPLGTRADVYSLGVVMYQLLTGELPGSRGGADATSPRRTTRVMPPDGGGRSSPVLRGALQKVVVQALSPDPRQRHGDARVLLRDLERVAVHLPRERDASFSLERLVRNWWWLPALLILVAALAALIWFNAG